MTFHLERRATAQPFRFTSPDPYWRKAASYAQALTALHMDALDNYKGGAIGPRPERTMLCDMLAAAAYNVGDLMLPFETRNLFAADAQPEAMFVFAACYPYSARHYANLVEDLRDYAVASLAEPSDENVHAYGSLPALLTALAQNLHTVTQFERRPIVAETVTPTRRIAISGGGV